MVVNAGSNDVTELSPAGVTLGTFAVDLSPVAMWVASNNDVIKL